MHGKDTTRRQGLAQASPIGTSSEPADASFTACVKRHLRRSGLSLSALARRSWPDISSVSRLVHLPCDPLNPRLDDQRDLRRPSRDAVIRLGLAMHLPLEDMDGRLLPPAMRHSCANHVMLSETLRCRMVPASFGRLTRC